MAGHSADPVRRDGEHTSEVEEPSHRHERPEDWGWHTEAGGWARGSAVLVAGILVLMITSTHERHIAEIYVFGSAALILLALAWDRRRRRNAWRE